LPFSFLHHLSRATAYLTARRVGVKQQRRGRVLDSGSDVSYDRAHRWEASFGTAAANARLWPLRLPPTRARIAGGQATPRPGIAAEEHRAGDAGGIAMLKVVTEGASWTGIG